MAYIQDSTQTFTISLVGLLEGLGIIVDIDVLVSHLGTITEYGWSAGVWTPSQPEAIEGDDIGIYLDILNNGAVTDTIFGQFVSADVTPGQALIQTGTVAVGNMLFPTWLFKMPPKNVSITINAGHDE